MSMELAHYIATFISRHGFAGCCGSVNARKILFADLTRSRM